LGLPNHTMFENLYRSCQCQILHLSLF
jgi:hypothetical protein